MNAELISYYRYASAQRALDEKVLPIIQQLQNTNINSFHQLRIKMQKLPQRDSLLDFNQTTTVFFRPNSTIPKFYSQREGKSSSKAHIEPAKQNSSSLSPTQKSSKSAKEPRLLMGLTSKVKRHLAEDINLKNMNEVMFQKRQTTNRFEQFCQSIREKKRSRLHQSYELSAKGGKMELSEQIHENYRVATRRKYSTQNRNIETPDQNSEFLRIQNFTKTIKS